MTISSIANTHYIKNKISYAGLKNEKSDSRNTQSNYTSYVVENSKQGGDTSKKEYKEFSDYAIRWLERRNLSKDDITRFSELAKAAESAVDSKEFLKSLSKEDKELVRRTVNYRNQISNDLVDKMSQEGARNLFALPCDYRGFVDYNNDGYAERGLDKLPVFPPPNAPEAVKTAWDKTVEGLSDIERGMAPFTLGVMRLNPDHCLIPSGEEEYKDTFFAAKTISEYFDLLDNLYAANELTKKYNNPGYERTRALIESFKNNINS